MLIAKPAARKDRSHVLRAPSTYDISEGEAKLGQMVLSRRDDTGLITLGERSCTIGRARPEENGAWRALVALAHGRVPEKAPPNPFLLRDAAGATVAAAAPARKAVAVSHAGREYRFKQIGFFNTGWGLYPPEGDRPLGTVAKKSAFSFTILIDLPAELDPAVQVFLFWMRLQRELESARNSPTTTT
ncbi:MAG TPA: hypothetical protein VMU06_19490 [Stellaceae bacterium]|nr:hypothetical protein [Stellaceae bacterium]